MSKAIVVHITTDELGGWQMALRNLRNLVQDDSVSLAATDIQVVINGPAVRFLLDSSYDGPKITTMAEAGVTVNACANSLSRFGYDPDDLTEGVTIVQSGVAEVVRGQQNGKQYLKLP